jgi:hypothetical protein
MTPPIASDLTISLAHLVKCLAALHSPGVALPGLRQHTRRKEPESVEWDTDLRRELGAAVMQSGLEIHEVRSSAARANISEPELLVSE